MGPDSIWWGWIVIALFAMGIVPPALVIAIQWLEEWWRERRGLRSWRNL